MSDQENPKQENSESPSDRPSKEECKRALKAFKKRLKLMRLDDESRIGGASMSGGLKSNIVAIRPPGKYPQEVWDELVRLGRLKEAGPGQYELATT
jgi:hypothetical protein